MRGLANMPYNTRRKSLSLPSLGIHIPVPHAARAAAAAASKKSSAAHAPGPRSLSPDSHPIKRFKRSHHVAAAAPETVPEQTPPPSPALVASVEMTDADQRPKMDLAAINDDIVEASIVQLLSTANRPHLIKELATVLSQKLASVQQSANPCAIISSRLTSYMKRTCWLPLAPCPLAKELEAVHPRRTYFFLTTCPRQPLPDPGVAPVVAHPAIVTTSVSLTDDSGSDDVEARRRDLSPSPEVDLSSPEFDDCDDDFAMPVTPIGSFKIRHLRYPRDMRHASPPLEKDEREFTQTADVLQKRKLSGEGLVHDIADRNLTVEFGYRDDIWFGDSRIAASATFLTSPAMKPSVVSSLRKDDESDAWLKINKMFELDEGAESIEIDELDCLLEGC